MESSPRIAQEQKLDGRRAGASRRSLATPSKAFSRLPIRFPAVAVADRCCYERFDRTGLLHLDVHWESNLQGKVHPS